MHVLIMTLWYESMPVQTKRPTSVERAHFAMILAPVMFSSARVCIWGGVCIAHRQEVSQQGTREVNLWRAGSNGGDSMKSQSTASKARM